jgi:hypothetical protein
LKLKFFINDKSLTIFSNTNNLALSITGNF